MDSFEIKKYFERFIIILILSQKQILDLSLLNFKNQTPIIILQL